MVAPSATAANQEQAQPLQVQQQSGGSQVEADLSSALSLANIRETLIRLEDTIIFSLIERAQFARNDAVYQPDAIPVPGFRADGRRYSLLEYLLRETEQVRCVAEEDMGWATGRARPAKLFGKAICPLWVCKPH